jgi:hypothetical protein
MPSRPATGTTRIERTVGERSRVAAANGAFIGRLS